MARRFVTVVVALILLLAARVVVAADPVHYWISVPEPEHHWMQVEAAFPDVPPGPLELHMSMSSPGRYALHEFAKNVYDVHVLGHDGVELTPARPDPSVWTVTGHGGSVLVRYKVFGNRLDGTYLGIDPTHLHLNMPAALVWARGLEDRPAVLTLTPPSNTRWQVATQLHPGSNPLEYSAPNLQYLMDSPVEFGPLALRQFTVGGHTFRFALHHTGSNADLDRFVKDVERIVQEEGKVFGEYPTYEPGRYTFIVDYLPYADDDGMEHRNSTVITASASIATSAHELLDAVAHEFFHSWNIERIRPRSLEPFAFDRPNMSGELWLGEGFTQYYGPLSLKRAGLTTMAEELRTLEGFVNALVTSPARLVRSAEQMSRMATFTDGGQPIDATNWQTTFLSYYTEGGAIALGLDLSLRAHSGGTLSLDDFMRAMWREYGRQDDGREGYVSRPFTLADVEATLGQVAGDPAFAHDFVARYIDGHDVVDYGALLARAGLVLRQRDPGHAWLGDLRFEARGGLHVASLVAPTAPVYRTGLDRGDEVNALDGEPVTTPDQFASILARHKPGDRVDLTYTDRRGQPMTASVALGENPRMTIVPIEAAGGAMTPAEHAFREAWLGGER